MNSEQMVQKHDGSRAASERSAANGVPPAGEILTIRDRGDAAASAATAPHRLMYVNMGQAQLTSKRSYTAVRSPFSRRGQS